MKLNLGSLETFHEVIASLLTTAVATPDLDPSPHPLPESDGGEVAVCNPGSPLRKIKLNEEVFYPSLWSQEAGEQAGRWSALVTRNVEKGRLRRTSERLWQEQVCASAQMSILGTISCDWWLLLISDL